MIKVTREKETCSECGRIKRQEEFDTFCDQCENHIPDNEEKPSISASYMVEDGRSHETDTDNWTRLTFCCRECYRDWVLNFKDNLPDNLGCFYTANPHLLNKEDFENYIGAFE